jgi:hypothetical protein
MADVIPANFLIPQRVLIEQHDGGHDACDVIVEMEDGNIYTAMFVTIPYLCRQMELSYEVAKQLPDTTPVRYAALDTPHILVESLERDTIEDTIDNLLGLDVFVSLFTQVTEDETQSTRTTTTTGTVKRATQEVAAVVISDVLVVEG